MTQKTAVITGGTGALGRAVVRRLLDEDVACHVTWKFDKELEEFEDRQRVTLHRLDCADERSVVAFYDRLHRVDASIHLVGGFTTAPTIETSAADLLAMFEVNAITAFLCTREAIKKMRGQPTGRIVNVAARCALQPTRGMVAYSTAKAAVVSITQSLAEEFRAEGLCINAIVPAIIDTPSRRLNMPNADYSKWPRPEEVAAAVSFLAGDSCGTTTGAMLPVYGRS